MTHLQNLNGGLEMKIIELQLKLDEGERERQAALNNWNTQKHNYEKVYTLHMHVVRTYMYIHVHCI